MFNCLHPIYFPIWLPQQCSRWTKKRISQKKVSYIFVLIPWYPISYLTIAGYGFFFLGAYGSLPDAAIWWCLRTGGGGVLTSVRLRRSKSCGEMRAGVRAKTRWSYGSRQLAVAGRSLDMVEPNPIHGQLLVLV